MKEKLKIIYLIISIFSLRKKIQFTSQINSFVVQKFKITDLSGRK
jgi:hypothetical protein